MMNKAMIACGILLLLAIIHHSSVALAHKHQHERLGHGKSCNLDTIKEEGACKDSWKNLKPRLHATQNSIGYAWVQFKLDTKCSNKDDCQDELDEKEVPVCKGPNNDVWILDHHHLLAALDASGYDKLKVTIHIVCDFSAAESLAEFWHSMEIKRTVYNYGRPPGQFDALPTTVAVDSIPLTIDFNETGTPFMDDHWRSLSGFIRKLNDPSCDVKYCIRGYEKICDANERGIPYFEYRWAYFFNNAYLNASTLWPSASQYNAFKTAYESLSPSQTTKVNTDPWVNVATLLQPLARSSSAGVYSVPESMGALSGLLPGYVGQGPIKERDPDCAQPVCGDFAAPCNAHPCYSLEVRTPH